MQNSAFPVPAPGGGAAAGLAAAIAAELAPQAERIDRDGFYPAAAMRALGAAGLFSAHLAAHNARPSIAEAVERMALVSETCMSTGFSTWCQDACSWYLEQSDNAGLRDRLQPGLADGTQMGGTGLSNPMKSFAGLEPLKLRGRRVPGGWEVTGVLPWVSNLGDGHLFGTVFGEEGRPEHRVMAMFRCGTGGVELRQNAHFVALEGTGTYSVLFRRAFLPQDWVLAEPLGGIVPRIRPGFVLLQTGMGLGVIRACIALMRDADTAQGGVNAFLPRRAPDFEADVAALWAEIVRLAATPLETAPEYVRAVLQVRLRTSELTLEAGQAALLHWGARGYLRGSAVDRRIREGHFVALITPSVRHLRQELAKPGLRAAAA